MIDIFSDQTLYERVIFALTGQFYHRAAGSAAALLVLRPTIQKKERSQHATRILALHGKTKKV